MKRIVVFVDCDLPRHPNVIYPEINEVVTISGIIEYPHATFLTLKEYPVSKVNNINGIHEKCFREVDDSFASGIIDTMELEIENLEWILA